jgi:hypothetical protein
MLAATISIKNITTATAAVNAPHSKRFAKFQAIRPKRQRLDCGGFSNTP